MANPGWYPDPDGTANRLRFWDGQSWTQQTMPAGGPGPDFQSPQGGGFQPQVGGNQPQSGGYQPQQGQGYGGQASYQPQLPPTSQRRSPLVPIIAAVVVLALLGMYALLNARGVVPGPFSPRSSSPATTAPTQQAPTGGVTTAVGQPMSCDYYSGDVVMADGTDASRMYGGRLSMLRPPGWEPSPMPLMFAAVGDSAAYVISDSWIAPAVLGKVSGADGFVDVQASAEAISGCITTHQDLYPGATGIEVVTSEPITVDGQPGYHIRSEVRLDLPELPEIEGDTVDIIVVDTGNDGELSFFFGAVPIGDTELQTVLDASVATLAVES